MVWSAMSVIFFNIILFCSYRVASAEENNQSVPFTKNDAFAYIASEIVITSYSIHYTKLYDIPFGRSSLSMAYMP